MKKHVEVESLLNNLPDDLPYKASVKRVLMQAPSADVVEVRCGEWISCEDRLPDGCGRFLVCRDTCLGLRAEILSYNENWYYYDREYGDVYFHDVTHWMPLPEVPKMKGE